MERKLIEDYKATVASLLDKLSPSNLALAVEIAEVPEHIRGFGHVKEQHLKDARAQEAVLVEAYRAGKSRAPVYMAAE
jgi:indolepyruvate ferredoxin oxidoreductase